MAAQQRLGDVRPVPCSSPGLAHCRSRTRPTSAPARPSAPPGTLRPASRAVDLPTSRPLEAERASAFHDAIMADIIEQRIYREVDLRALFRRWRDVNPPEYQAALTCAVNIIKADLNVA